MRWRRDGRWLAYAQGEIHPRVLRGHTNTVWALAIGPDGNMYSGSMDRTIRVWSAKNGTLLRMLPPRHHPHMRVRTNITHTHT
jgi:WD40 repeat protein